MSDENEPVHLNMTPMIDVVFQLIVFFIVSMKFKSLDMKIEAELPKECGMVPGPARPPDPKVDVRLRRAGRDSPTEIRVGSLSLGNAADESAWIRLKTCLDVAKARAADSSVRLIGEVDAAPAVATADVVHALDVLHAAEFSDVRFTGTPLLR
ncbi:MAG: biopolymer transporter ExbD [Planctomycetes bacterium]|nr:biopolymer transporter ExbD [Planctomycetota bacterium]